MDMAPGANLYLVRAASVAQMTHALQWLVGNGVDVINLSATTPFEGPGDGTTQRSVPDSLLALIDSATQHNITWVNAAGNYADGQNWATMSPVVSMFGGDRWISFSGSNTIDNGLLASPGDINLRWHHRTDANTDLDLHVYNGSGQMHRSSEKVQWNATMPVSTEQITFGGLPSTSGPYTVRIQVVSATVPEFIQLTIDYGLLRYSTQNMSLGNPADSRNTGMLAVGAIEQTALDSFLDAPYSS